MSKKLLLIDDDGMVADLIKAITTDIFEVVHAATGREGVEAAASERPDLILLDVGLPDKDGYAICRMLKANPKTVDIPVIFISARNDLPDRLRGYEAGGEDYITKPISPPELRKKLRAVHDSLSKSKVLRSAAADAARTAFVAMESAGDVRGVLDFMREISHSADFALIAQTSLRALDRHSLHACIQLRSRLGQVSINSEGPCSPLEESVLERMASYDAVYDLGTRSAFNYPGVSIIVYNMPTDNVGKCNRIKEVVAMIAEAIDIRMKTLDLQLESVERGMALVDIVQNKTVAIGAGVAKTRRYREGTLDIVGKLAKEMEDAFLYLGLTDKQEKSVLSIVNDAVERTRALHADTVANDGVLETLTQELGHLRQTFQP